MNGYDTEQRTVREHLDEKKEERTEKGVYSFDTLMDELKKKEGNRVPGRMDRERETETAVVVPFIEKNGEPYLLFEVRSNHLKSQPGEVCFPGGRMEDGETPKEAAFREAVEELKIREEQMDLIAPLDLLITPAGVTVYPFLIRIREYRQSYSKEEVERILEIPLSWFLTREPKSYRTRIETVPNEDFPFELIPNGRGYSWRKGTYLVLFYEHEQAVIWGMTAKIVHSFIQMYRRDISDSVFL